jgi:hypothetical protein
MATTDRKSTYREDFPGYQGFIPYKYSIIGKNIGATNEAIKSLLTDEPPKETLIRPGECKDFSHYNRDYYNDNFDRSYPLEEEKIYTNKSKDAKTWISGDKYKIYPQHIPNTQCHVPGIYSSNIYGMGFSKASAIAIKGDYNKEADVPSEERYKSTNQVTYKMPKTRGVNEENLNFNLPLKTEPTFFMYGNGRKLSQSVDKLYKIYHSKIARVPTVGYTGCANENIFQKPVGYLNYDKILEKERIIRAGPGKASYADLPPKFQESLKIITPDDDVPFVSGYRGFKAGIKAKGLYGANTQELALQARNQEKLKRSFL